MPEAEEPVVVDQDWVRIRHPKTKAEATVLRAAFDETWGDVDNLVGDTAWVIVDEKPGAGETTKSKADQAKEAAANA